MIFRTDFITRYLGIIWLRYVFMRKLRCLSRALKSEEKRKKANSNNDYNSLMDYGNIILKFEVIKQLKQQYTIDRLIQSNLLWFANRYLSKSISKLRIFYSSKNKKYFLIKLLK